MEESRKETVNYFAKAGTEATLSAIPVIGGPLAVFYARTVEFSQVERNQRLLNEVAQRLDQLTTEGIVPDLEDFLQSDLFLANLNTTFRAIQETADRDLQERLKQALVVGTKVHWRSRSERFTKILVRMNAMHIQVLSAVYELSEGKVKSLGSGTALVRDLLSANSIQRSESDIAYLCNHLASEGLLMVGDLAPIKDEHGSLQDSGQARRLRFSKEGLKMYEFLNASD